MRTRLFSKLVAPFVRRATSLTLVSHSNSTAKYADDQAHRLVLTALHDNAFRSANSAAKRAAVSATKPRFSPAGLLRSIELEQLDDAVISHQQTPGIVERLGCVEGFIYDISSGSMYVDEYDRVNCTRQDLDVASAFDCAETVLSSPEQYQRAFAECREAERLLSVWADLPIYAIHVYSKALIANHCYLQVTGDFNKATRFFEEAGIAFDVKAPNKYGMVEIVADCSVRMLLAQLQEDKAYTKILGSVA